MRRSKLCIGCLVIGIGGSVILASMGNAQAASLLPLLPLLACPLMCAGMMMLGKSCHDEKCEQKKATEPTSKTPDAQR